MFILGAGASKHAGAPLMFDFLEKAEQIYKAGKTGIFKSDFERVLDGISKLQAVHSKSALKLNDIESVFATFEMARLINRFPGISSGEEIESLLVSIKRLILQTLEQTITYPIRNGYLHPPDAYNSFAKLINDFNDNGRRNRCSIITFNYDVALDSALNFNGHPPDYCLSETLVVGYTPLMKLHGSLNWTRCSKCKEIVPWNLFDFFRTHRFIRGLLGITSVHLDIGSQLPSSNLIHCDDKVEPEPFIIPPTWNKTAYHQGLSRVWSNAALHLSEAEYIFVSGYSFPASDYIFKYLYTLGSVGPRIIKRFCVFDTNGDVSNRFKELLGEDTRGKFCNLLPMTFEVSIDWIRNKIFPEIKA